MALHVSYKPGMKQSLQAARYFNSTAEEAMEAVITGLTARQYLVSVPEGEDLRLRIWSSAELSEGEMELLLDWLRCVHLGLEALQEEEQYQAKLPHVLENWLAVRDKGLSFFLEQRPLDDDGGDAEGDPEISMGVLGGHTIMISTDTVMFTQLQAGIFGLSVARKGSYLIEQVDGEDRDRKELRRA